MDTIFINELRIETRIGIYAWEQQVAQALLLDLEIGLRGSHAAHSDNITDTIDYATVVARIRELFSGQHFSLLEHAAEAIAQMIFCEFNAPWLCITIAKVTPLPGVRRLGVTIERNAPTAA